MTIPLVPPSQAKTVVPILRDGGGLLPKYQQKAGLSASADWALHTHFLSLRLMRLTPGSNGGPMEPGVVLSRRGSLSAFWRLVPSSPRLAMPSTYAGRFPPSVFGVGIFSYGTTAEHSACQSHSRRLRLYTGRFAGRLEGRTRPSPVGPAGPPGQPADLTAIFRALATSVLGTQIPNRPSRIFASILEPSTESGRKNRRLKEP